MSRDNKEKLVSVLIVVVTTLFGMWLIYSSLGCEKLVEKST